MENNASPIRSLQELKNLLDSGAITQQEYDVLKQKIIFGQGGSTASAAAAAPLTPDPVPRDPVAQDYSNEAYVGFDTGRNATAPDPDALGPDGVVASEPVHETKGRDMLVTILITLGVLLLVGLIAYQLMNDKESEKLTSTSGAAPEAVDSAAVTAPRVQESPQTFTVDSSALPARANVPNANATAGNADPAAGTPASASALTEEEIASRAKDRLESYYDDMRNAPFSAQRHFAPTVERYYTLVNTTPAAINENINSFHFPEFQDSEASIEENSMKVITAPNSYEVTYIENGTAFRKSKNQKQQTKARVRARFDQNFKLTYFRQEQLLENTFVE